MSSVITGDLAQDFVVLDPDKAARQHRVTPSFFQEELPRAYPDFSGHELISCCEFGSDWNSWERHPHGDEFVLLLSGRVRFLLRDPAQPGEESVELSQPGTYLIVPRGAWHTARTDVPSRLLFITPGQDTEHAVLD